MARDVPEEPGVYAWYRGGIPVYVGKADDLRDRAWKRHMGQGRTLRTSAFRRNVAEHLGFGSANDLLQGMVVLDPSALASVRKWILGCELGWIVCATPAAAISLERRMKAEFLPLLTKR